MFPAPSIDRNRTTVTPSLVTNTLAPSTGDVYGAPFVDVSLWYPTSPEPPLSLDPDALSGSIDVFCQPAPALLTFGSVGLVRSIRAVATTQLLVLPDTSTARNRTSVSPSAVTDRDAPVDVDPQVAPPSVETCRW